MTARGLSERFCAVGNILIRERRKETHFHPAASNEFILPRSAAHSGAAALVPALWQNKNLFRSAALNKKFPFIMPLSLMYIYPFVLIRIIVLNQAVIIPDFRSYIIFRLIREIGVVAKTSTFIKIPRGSRGFAL